MRMIICLRCNDTKVIRNVTVRRGWFGRTHVTAQGREYTIGPNDQLTLDIPISVSLVDAQPEKS